MLRYTTASSSASSSACMMAAASLSLVSSSFNTYCTTRMSRVCLSIPSDQLQKCIMYTDVSLRTQNYNLKLYNIPSTPFSCCSTLKCFATAGSLGVDTQLQGNQTSSSIWAPTDSKRSFINPGRLKKPFDKDLEIKLQELFDEVKSMIRMGNKTDAFDLLKANYEAVKDQMDVEGRGIEEAAILDVLALGYLAVGDFKMVGLLLDVLSDVVNGLPDDEPLLDSVLTHMGSMYSTLGKFEKSMLSYKRVIGITEKEYGNNSTFLITPLLGMGKVLGFIGRASKATDMYHRAIRILESCCGTESEQLVVPLFALGNLLIKEGKVADAEKTFVRILDIYMRLYGEADGRVAMAMCSLANVKCAKGNSDEAINLYRNALQLLKKDSNSTTLDDDMMEKIRIDLAELLHLVGRGREGRALLEECLLITEKHKGKDHPRSVTHLINLATSYSRSKNFVEAERLLRRSLQIMRSNVSPDDQSITFPMLNLAVTLYNLNRNEEAEQLALEVLRVREKAFGKESLPVGEAMDCLVSIQSRMEKDDTDLLQMLKRILRIQEKAFGNDSEEVMETLKKIVFYLDKMGLKNEKFPLQKRLSVLRAKYKQMVRY